MAPILSILVPVYNSAATLRETLVSVTSSYEVEVVLSDDCSPDAATQILLDELEAEGYTVVRAAVNAGPGAALNIAAAASTGRYIMELDADDLVAEGAIDRLIEELEADPELDLVWGDTSTFGDSSYRKVMVPHLDPWYVCWYNGMPCCAMMRRSAWEKAGRWPEDRRGFQDWAMWIAMGMSGARGRRLDMVMLHYRVQATGMFKSTKSRHAEIRKATMEQFEGIYPFRRRAWLRSRAPLSVRLLLPLTPLLPVNSYVRSRLVKAMVTGLWMRDWGSVKGRLAEARGR